MTTATLTRPRYSEVLAPRRGLPAVIPTRHALGTALKVKPRPGFTRRHETQTGIVARVTPHWAAGEHMTVYWLCFDGDTEQWPYAESEVEVI
jgi:hypothetical protein